MVSGTECDVLFFPFHYFSVGFVFRDNAVAPESEGLPHLRGFVFAWLVAAIVDVYPEEQLTGLT